MVVEFAGFFILIFTVYLFFSIISLIVIIIEKLISANFLDKIADFFRE